MRRNRLPQHPMSHAHILTHTAGTGAGASGMPWFEAASRSRKPAGIPSGVCAAIHPNPRVFAGI